MKLKSLVASAFMAMLGISAMAQTDLETFQFVDKAGNVVPDGTTLTVSEVENGDKGLQISTGLFIKNTSGKEQAIGMNYDILTLPNGNYSICFPGQCEDYPSVGLITKGPFIVEASETPEDLQAEWILTPNVYGTSTVTIQALIYEVSSKIIFGTEIPEPGDFKAYGPKITLNLVYADPTGINGVTDNADAKVISRYNAAGMRVNSAVKGLNIEKLSNGKTIKRIVKQ